MSFSAGVGPRARSPECSAERTGSEAATGGLGALEAMTPITAVEHAHESVFILVSQPTAFPNSNTAVAAAAIVRSPARTSDAPEPDQRHLTIATDQRWA